MFDHGDPVGVELDPRQLDRTNGGKPVKSNKQSQQSQPAHRKIILARQKANEMYSMPDRKANRKST